VEAVGGGLWRLQNRNAWTVLLDTLSFLHDRAALHRNRGTLSARLLELDADLRETVGGRILPRVVESLDWLRADATLRGELDALLLDLLDQSTLERTRELRRIAAWALQALMVDRVTVPWARALGNRLDPQSPGLEFIPGSGCRYGAPPFPLLSRLMDLILRLAPVEGQGQRVFAKLVENAGALYPAGGYPVDDWIALLLAVHRVDPLQTGEETGQDFANVLQQVAGFLLDDLKGVEKLYLMVDRRDGF
jgi:hypothetical protein